MNAAELTSDTVKSGIYNVCGDDLYFVDKVEEVFRGLTDENGLKIYSEIRSIDEISDGVLTVSFFGEPNVVIVKLGDYKLDKRGHEQLKKILSVDVSPNYLVFINAAFLDAAEKKLMTEIRCARLRKPEIVNLVAREMGNRMERSAINTLVDYTNCDMARLNLELTKLKDYSGEGTITENVVKNLVVEDADLQIYQFVNSVVSGNNALALKQVDVLVKRGEAYNYLLASLILQFRRMLYGALSPLDDKALADILKVKEFAVTKARERSGFTKAQLKNTVDMLIGYELQFKSGIMSDKSAFESAVARLLAKEVRL